MTLPLHGETVQITGWFPIARGYFKEYKCFFEIENPDGGKPISNSLFFDERVAETFRKAGHTQVKWEFTHKTHSMAHVDVVIEDIDNTYQIVAVTASDGTVHKVPQKERPKRASRNPNPDALKRQYTDPATLARLVKKEAEQAKAERFKHGVELHMYHRTNPYYLMEVTGEYVLMKRKDRLAA